jgi:hypothetical protein
MGTVHHAAIWRGHRGSNPCSSLVINRRIKVLQFSAPRLKPLKIPANSVECSTEIGHFSMVFALWGPSRGPSAFKLFPHFDTCRSFQIGDNSLFHSLTNDEQSSANSPAQICPKGWNASDTMRDGGH